jgi:hypothetical protein
MLDKLAALNIELLLYSSFKDGWDGSQSRAPADADINDAQTLLSRLPSGIPIPKPMLSSNGKVGLYWDTDKLFADIAFDGGGKFSLFSRSKTDAPHELFSEGLEIGGMSSNWLSDNLVVLFNA